MSKGKNRNKLRQRVFDGDRGTPHHEAEPVERLARGEFVEADFHALLLLLQVCEWVRDTKPEHVDLPVRTTTAVLQEVLLDLFARRRSRGVWAAGPDLPRLRDAVHWLADWMATLPGAVIAQAHHELKQRYEPDQGAPLAA